MQIADRLAAYQSAIAANDPNAGALYRAYRAAKAAADPETWAMAMDEARLKNEQDARTSYFR